MGINFLHWYKFTPDQVKLFHFTLTYIVSRNKLSRHVIYKPYLGSRGIRYSFVSSVGSLIQNMCHQSVCPLFLLDWKQKGLQIDRKSFKLILLLTRVVPLNIHLDPECFPTLTYPLQYWSLKLNNKLNKLKTAGRTTLFL